VLCLAAACNRDSPARPGLINPGGDASRNGSIAGKVVGYEAGAPVGGATVVLGGSAVTTNAQGDFTLGGVPNSGSGVLTVNASGHLFRGVGVSLAPNLTGVRIDLIRDAAPFDLQFYRWFVRNGFEQLELQTTKPWTMAPSFYVRTVVQGTGAPVAADVLDRIRELFARSVPELTGGRFQMAAFETGPDAREPQLGWVLLTFYSTLGAAFGQSTVGGNSATMSIRYGMVSSQTTNPFNCYSPEVGVADHELTHAMGYWHTPNIFADTFSGPGCPGTWPPHVRYHAAVMYSRPPGNRDPDIDPSASANVNSSSKANREVRLVSCVW
jgi:hypothetical protein